MTASLIASTSQVLWRILEAKGIDPAPVFQEAHLDPGWLHNPYMRFPNAELDDAWFLATGLTADPCIGLKAALFINPVSLHALGFAWLASDSLYDALSRLVRYSDLIADGSRLNLATVKDVCRLTIDYAAISGRAAPQRMDSFWAGLVALARLITSENLSPTSLSLRRLPPPCVDEYYALFRAPITFGADKDSIEFARDIAHRALPTANLELAHTNDEVIKDYIARINAQDLPGRVKTRLIDTLPSGEFSEADVADSLNLSTRTLQRRLAEEGTSFKVLLDEARRELAMRFVGEQRYSIKETSYLLGFSEPGNFSRAFRRWTGTSPSQYRGSRSS